MFHALYRKKDDELPKTTPLQIQKKRQIDSIKTNYGNVTEVVKEVHYRIPVNTTNVALTLIILLPPHFPQDGPIIHVTPTVLHPWVNKEQQITGCLALKNFTMHSDLGRIIQDIIEEFQKRPPVPDGIALHEDMFEQPLPFFQHDPSAVIGHPYTSVPSFIEAKTMDILLDPGYHFLELNSLSSDNLENLKDDDEKLTEFIDKLFAKQCLDLELKTLHNQNEAIASENLEKQPLLESLKKTLKAKTETATTLKQKFEEKNHSFQELSAQYSPRIICENLKIETMKAEEESEKLALTFLHNKIDVDEFLNLFIDKRTLYHQRRVKEEKLQGQLLELQRLSH